MAVGTGYWHPHVRGARFGLTRVPARLSRIGDDRSLDRSRALAPSASRVDDLSEARVAAVLDRWNIRTLGREYVFRPAVRRTMTEHPLPRQLGSLVLTDDLSEAISGRGAWHAGLPGDDVAGSIVLTNTNEREALLNGSLAMRVAIAAHAEIDVTGDLVPDCPAAELFVGSRRKVAGLLAEDEQDGTVILGFCLRANAPDKARMRAGESSLLIESGNAFPRDLLVGAFLKMLELIMYT